MLNVTTNHRETRLFNCYQHLVTWIPELEEWLGNTDNSGQIVTVVREVRSILILRFEFGSVIS
jgi:hypothetical protein